MKCYLCNKDIEDISKFCEYCGAKIEKKEEKILLEDINEDISLIEKENQDEPVDIIKEENIKEDNLEEMINIEKESIDTLGNIKEKTIDDYKTENLNKEVKEINKYDSEKKNNKKVSIIKKIIIGVIALNLLALFSGFIYLNKINDPVKVVLKFNEAIENENYEELLEVATTVDTSVEINEFNAKALFKLYNENIEIKEEIKKILNEDVLRVKNDMGTDINKIVSLIEDKHGLYSTYKVAIQDYDITLMANLDNVKVSGFEKEVNLNNEYEEFTLKNVLLGKYDVKATSIDESEIEYVDEKIVDVNYNNYLEFNFEFTDVTIIEPELEVVNIYVNDKVYDKSFNGGILEISPISYNTVIKIECKTSWGVILSSSYQVIYENGYNVFEPQFKIDEDTRISLMRMACEYYDNVFTAFNNRDIETLEAMNYRNNIYEIDYLLDDIDYMKESEYGHYEVIYIISNLAADKYFVLEDVYKNEFIIYVEATVEQNSTYYNSDNEIESDDIINDKDNQGYDITIKNIDGEWIVTDMTSDYFRDMNEIYNYN